MIASEIVETIEFTGKTLRDKGQQYEWDTSRRRPLVEVTGLEKKQNELFDEKISFAM
jgi:hypothetical protein